MTLELIKTENKLVVARIWKTSRGRVTATQCVMKML